MMATRASNPDPHLEKREHGKTDPRVGPGRMLADPPRDEGHTYAFLGSQTSMPHLGQTSMSQDGQSSQGNANCMSSEGCTWSLTSCNLSLCPSLGSESSLPGERQAMVHVTSGSGSSSNGVQSGGQLLVDVDGGGQAGSLQPVSDCLQPAGVQPAGDCLQPASGRQQPAGDRQQPVGDCLEPAGDCLQPTSDCLEPPSLILQQLRCMALQVSCAQRASLRPHGLMLRPPQKLLDMLQQASSEGDTHADRRSLKSLLAELGASTASTASTNSINALTHTRWIDSDAASTGGNGAGRQPAASSEQATDPEPQQDSPSSRWVSPSMRVVQPGAQLESSSAPSSPRAGTWRVSSGGEARSCGLERAIAAVRATDVCVPCAPELLRPLHRALESLQAEQAATVVGGGPYAGRACRSLDGRVVYGPGAARAAQSSNGALSTAVGSATNAPNVRFQSSSTGQAPAGAGTATSADWHLTANTQGSPDQGSPAAHDSPAATPPSAAVSQSSPAAKQCGPAAEQSCMSPSKRPNGPMPTTPQPTHPAEASRSRHTPTTPPSQDAHSSSHLYQTSPVSDRPGKALQTLASTATQHVAPISGPPACGTGAVKPESGATLASLCSTPITKVPDPHVARHVSPAHAPTSPAVNRPGKAPETPTRCTSPGTNPMKDQPAHRNHAQVSPARVTTSPTAPSQLLDTGSSSPTPSATPAKGPPADPQGPISPSRTMQHAPQLTQSLLETATSSGAHQVTTPAKAQPADFPSTSPSCTMQHAPQLTQALLETALSSGAQQATSSNGHQVTSSNGHQVTSSNGHQVTSSNGHQVTSSNGHQVTSSNGHQVTSSNGHQVTSSDGHLVTTPVKVQQPALAPASPLPSTPQPSRVLRTSTTIIVPEMVEFFEDIVKSIPPTPICTASSLSSPSFLRSQSRARSSDIPTQLLFPDALKGHALDLLSEEEGGAGLPVWGENHDSEGTVHERRGRPARGSRAAVAGLPDAAALGGNAARNSAEKGLEPKIGSYALWLEEDRAAASDSDDDEQWGTGAVDVDQAPGQVSSEQGQQYAPRAAVAAGGVAAAMVVGTAGAAVLAAAAGAAAATAAATGAVAVAGAGATATAAAAGAAVVGLCGVRQTGGVGPTTQPSITTPAYEEERQAQLGQEAVRSGEVDGHVDGSALGEVSNEEHEGQSDEEGDDEDAVPREEEEWEREGAMGPFAGARRQAAHAPWFVMAALAALPLLKR